MNCSYGAAVAKQTGPGPPVCAEPLQPAPLATVGRAAWRPFCMPGCKPKLMPSASAVPFLRVPVQVGESTPLQDAFLLADDVLRQVGSRRRASGSAAAA